MQNPLTSPVFIVGSYRSGTSVFAWCLGQHPNIVNLPETNWLYRLGCDLDGVYKIGTDNGRHSHLSQMHVTEKEFFRDIGQSLDCYIHNTKSRLAGYDPDRKSEYGSGFMRRRNDRETKSRWVDATPENSHHVEVLIKLFPDAKFIHLLRHPDAVARSLMSFSTAGGYDRSMVMAYRDWYRLVSACKDAEMKLSSSQIMRLEYEDMVADPLASLTKVLNFLGESYCEACADPLGKRINSSKVEKTEHTPGLISSILSSSMRKRAHTLYEELTNHNH